MESPSVYSEECETGVNKQINLELYASNVSLLMSASFVDGLDVIMQKYSDKAREHAQMLMKYQNDRGGHLVLQDIEKPERDRCGTALEACNAAMEMSGDILQALLDLRRVAANNKDGHMTEFISDRLIGKRGEHRDLRTELKLWVKEHVLTKG